MSNPLQVGKIEQLSDRGDLNEFPCLHKLSINTKYCDNCAEIQSMASKVTAELRLEYEKKLAEERAAYNDLIMCVARKFPNETRHETAKRYIRQAEEHKDNQTYAANAKLEKP